MSGTKKPFEEIVVENSAWLLRYIRRLSSNNGWLAEDLLQDTLLKCYMHYYGYTEEGKIKSWLARVARNTVYSYYRKASRFEVVSIDGDDCLADDISDERSAEDVFLRRDMVGNILKAMSNMSDMQKKVFNYRVYDDMSVAETSRKLGIPEGTVKSASYYAIRKIRNAVDDGVSKEATTKNDRRGIIMTCKEAYALLFMYAKNTISDEDRAAVEEHIASCRECADIASSLKILVSKMSFEPENGERMHYSIGFTVNNGSELLSYCGSSEDLSDKYERFNAKLAENGGKVPDGENWFNHGFDTCFDLIGEFDNEGNKIDYDIFISGNKRVAVTGLKKVFPYHWSHEVLTTTSAERLPIAKMPDYPDMYMGYIENGFGCDVHSAVYLAIPADVKNLRVKSGTGIIDGGAYKFAYTTAFVYDTEDIHIACTFIK